MLIGEKIMEVDKLALVDYWLSKLMFDLQNPASAAKWKDDRVAILDQYPLRPDARAAVLDDDIEFLSRHVNAYLLRFYYSICGASDAEFIARLHALQPGKGQLGEGTKHG
jgi:hypothetical protein